ncbi:MAG: 16S rRNA (cytosine(1402)-N(4))-methyltransferase RsmH [Thermomicrobiales bacterium]|nr:16S rRNA (cytosine(1402)-N(4))-methyltransferase RsmH [Thermomicrobiales bacterium]
MQSGHISVLLHEAVDALQPRAGGVYIDGTFGGGGHTTELLTRLNGVATVYAIDADPAAMERADRLRSTPIGAGLIPVHSNFRELARIAADLGIPPVDGILLDLGLSSYQLDQAERGFAFRFDGPLDMRFNPEAGESAADIVNHAPQEELASIIWRYGEEKQSRQVARVIVERRKQAPFTSTADLAAVIEKAVGGRRGKSIHPATRTFQALRIAVNDELSALESVLDAAVGILTPGGRLVVISFHSREDRIVKQFMALESTDCICPPDVPVCVCHHSARLRRIGKPVRPTDSEQTHNARSRSAIMRIAERVG